MSIERSGLYVFFPITSPELSISALAWRRGRSIRSGTAAISGLEALTVREMLLHFFTLNPGFGFCSATHPLGTMEVKTESITWYLILLFLARASVSFMVRPKKSGTGLDCPCLV